MDGKGGRARQSIPLHVQRALKCIFDAIPKNWVQALGHVETVKDWLKEAVG
jgi:hypothetical protein